MGGGCEECGVRSAECGVRNAEGGEGGRGSRRAVHMRIKLVVAVYNTNVAFLRVLRRFVLNLLVTHRLSYLTQRSQRSQSREVRSTCPFAAFAIFATLR
jgi:hypothetical protein